MRSSISLSAVLLLGVVLFTAGSIRADGLFGLLKGHYVNGSGDLITEARDLEPFTELEISGSFDVLVSCGEKQKVEITIDDNLMDLITTRVRGGKLTIKCEESISAHRRSRVEISVPSLESVALCGSGDLSIRNMHAEEIDMSVSGSGSINAVDIEATLLSITVSGSGEMTADGKTDDLYIRISGSGGIDLKELIAEEAEVRVSGSGDVELYAEESFTGRVTGSGDIRIHGNPATFTERISGSGNIKRL